MDSTNTPLNQNQDDAVRLRGTLEDVKLIGTGGMSQIFRARQPGLERFIVIKRLKEELLANEEAKERFRREAKALASVLHQNIAHVYDFVETQREAYILMEHIDGIDVSTVVAKLGHLPPRICAAILWGVSRGVQYIHSHHLVHRDIKPGNIRLNTRGEVKLMDFGIVMDVANESLTRPGMMVGSPSYLSPEQVLGDPITPSADIFLLGICFYEMLTGSRPFKDEGGETVYQRIRESKFTPVRKMQPKVPAALEAIVHRCLQKSPEKRFGSVGEMMDALEVFLGPRDTAHPEEAIIRFLDEEALLTPSIAMESRVATSPRLRSGGGVSRWLIGAVILITVALMGLGGVWAYRMGREKGLRDAAQLKEQYGSPKDMKKRHR